MTNHTPGPWHVSSQGRYVRKSDGDWPAWNICEMNDASQAMRDDAALIAAAPELLAKLREAVEAMREVNPDYVFLKGWEETIAKAKVRS